MNEKKKILWVEDDYYHLKDLTRQLTKNGFEIISARSYEQAIDELNTHKEHLSLILLDLIIPNSSTKSVVPNMSEEEYEDTVEVPKDLVEYGIKLLKYMMQELQLTIPIIVLSIITTKEIINELENNGIKRLHKLGLLPNKLKEIVFEELSIKSDLV